MFSELSFSLLLENCLRRLWIKSILNTSNLTNVSINERALHICHVSMAWRKCYTDGKEFMAKADAACEGSVLTYSGTGGVSKPGEPK